MNTTIASAVAARDNAAAEIIAIDAKIEKLEAASQKSSPATIELAQLCQDAAHAAANWNGEGDLPIVDHKREARLRDEIAAFELSKRSAQDGIKTLVDRKIAAQKTRDSAERHAKIEAFKFVLETEGCRLVAEINAARQHLADLDATRKAIHELVLAQARILDERSLFTAVENAHVMFAPIEGKADLAPLNAKIDSLLNPKKAA